MPRSDFARCLEAAQRRLNRANMEFARTEQLVAKKDMPAAFGSALRLKPRLRNWHCWRGSYLPTLDIPRRWRCWRKRWKALSR